MGECPAVDVLQAQVGCIYRTTEDIHLKLYCVPRIKNVDHRPRIIILKNVYCLQNTRK